MAFPYNHRYQDSIQSHVARPWQRLSGHARLAFIIVLPTVARSMEHSTVSRAVVLTTDTVTLATRVTCSHVTKCRTNSHGSGRSVTGPITTAFLISQFERWYAIFSSKVCPVQKMCVMFNQIAGKWHALLASYVFFSANLCSWQCETITLQIQFSFHFHSCISRFFCRGLNDDS